MNTLFDRVENKAKADGFTLGKIEGKVEGKVEVLGLLLRNSCEERFGRFPQGLSNSVKSISDPDLLLSTYYDALKARSLDEVESLVETKLMEISSVH